jgi:drug/metabolite transporter (DMT)-like permease
MSKGVFWSFLSAFLWSTTFVCSRYLIGGRSVDPFTLATLRFSGGGLLLLAAGLIWRRGEILALRWRDALQCALLAVFGMGGMCVFLFYGQKTVGAIDSSILMQVSPVFIVILGLFVGERMTWVGVGGLGLSFVGTLLVMGVLDRQGLHLTLSHGAGSLLIIASALCWAVYAVFSKGLVARLGGYAATTWVMLAGALELFVLQLVLPVAHQWPDTTHRWLAIAYLAVFPTAVGYLAWYEAMRLIRLSLLNVMQYLTPVFVIVLAWMLLGERLSVGQWVGAAIVLGGVWLVSLGHAPSGATRGARD